MSTQSATVCENLEPVNLELVELNREEGCLEERLLGLEKELARLRRENEEIRKSLAAVGAVLLRKADFEADPKNNIDRRLSQLEQNVRRTAGLVNEILDSRIWKSLQAGGGVILDAMKVLHRERRPPKGKRGTAEHSAIAVYCDSLPRIPKHGISGVVDIRGWAVARHGIASLEIRVDEGEPLETKYGMERPDLVKHFPDFPAAAQAGFSCNFDTGKVSDGVHTITIRAMDQIGKSSEIQVAVLVEAQGPELTEYERWLLVAEPDEPEITQLRITQLSYRPKLSVLVPVFRTSPGVLKEMVNSVIRQSYTDWELCLVDDGSGDDELTASLDAFAGGDRRILFATQENAGISAATNRALAMATGEYVVLLDHDDMLAKDALFHIAAHLQEQPRADLLYSDEDHMDEAGRRFSPFFKPDWSPDLILSENYVCHLMAFRRELAIEVGGFRSRFDLSQDHDILLRLSRKANRVVHIPRILYHWRTSITSMNRASNSEERAIASSRDVVANYCEEMGEGAWVEDGCYHGRWRVRYPVSAGTRVSILIPTAGKLDMLGRNLDSLWLKAGKTELDVVLIDNSKNRDDRRVRDFAEALRDSGRPVSLFDQRGEPFNYSVLNNNAAKTLDAPLLLFLNDDTEGIADGWLDAMAELAMRPEVGAVGAKLLYPDGKIQHGGVTIGLAGICGHSFQSAAGDSRHYYDFPDVIRNVSAVTAACVMVRNSVFQEVGGFDGRAFPIAYNDIDLCLRIGEKGYRILYTPHALLTHYEAASKSHQERDPHPAETIAFQKRWSKLIERDPFYNPNLTRHLEDWSLRWD